MSRWGRATRIVAISCLGMTLTIGPLAGETTPPPEPALNISGDQGGPFSPSYFTCQIVNSAQVGAYWSATQVPAWLELEMTNGYLAPGGQITLTATVNDQAKSLPPGTYVNDITIQFVPQPGDFNGDQKVDALDLKAFEPCLSAAGLKHTPECAGPDLDFDGDVDQDDYGVFQRCFSGSATADRNCK